MRNRVRPERWRCATSHQVGSRELHDAADCSLSDSVQLVNVWGASRSMHSAFCEQFRELSR
eukprot:674911-Pleurochrysis_carterae.AAC.1